MATSSRSRPITLCAKSAVPEFSRTLPERKSGSSMKDHVGMDRGNHIHGGLAAQPTTCGERATKSIASIAMDMHCKKEKSGKQAGLCNGLAADPSIGKRRCH